NAYEQGPILPAGAYWRTNTATLPVMESGNYYLIFSANAEAALAESNYSNNFALQPLAITIEPPDLAPLTTLVPSSLTGPPFPSLSLVWGTTNQGTGLAVGSWYDTVYFSTNAALDSADFQIFSGYHSDPLPAGSSY